MRAILHVDMDAFFAAIEQRDDSKLRGRPVVVGGGTRGVVAAASYEARRYGIRSAMPMAEAMRRCSSLVRVPPRGSRYREVSRQIFDVFHEFTPVVEGLSLDEAFLDVSASLRLFGSARGIALAIKARIRERTSLSASVGVAANKLVAKIASDLEKPDGLVVIPDDDVLRRLEPLPVAVIPGIGPKKCRELAGLGIATLGELRRASDALLLPVFGRYAERARQRAAGIDDRPVVASRQGKSVSAEETFDTDLGRPADIDRALAALAEKVAARLRHGGLMASTVQVKIRRPDFETVTRQQLLKPPANGTDAIFLCAKQLLAEWLAGNPGARIRLLGVGASGLARASQLELFGAAGPARTDRAVDEIRDRFGEAAVARARSLGRRH